MATRSATTVVGAKVSAAVAAKLDQLAADRRLTVSLLLRSLIERELAATQGETTGDVETATRIKLDELADVAVGDPRIAMALNLARRMDVDPSNGAQHSRELDRLLRDLERVQQGNNPDELDEIIAWALLDRRGYGVRCQCGAALCLSSAELRERGQVPIDVALADPVHARDCPRWTPPFPGL